MAIPKIIHQTFESWDSLPRELHENCLNISSLNTDHEYRFYGNKDRTRFILEHYGEEILRAYDRINPFYGAARADFFRYLCIYRLGGIYLDLKTKVEWPFSSVLNDYDSYILSTWQSSRAADPKRNWGVWPELTCRGLTGEFQTWYIAAQPGHPFLEAVISTILRRIQDYLPFRYDTSHEAIIHTTGPVAYTLAIAPILDRHSHRIVRTEEDLGLSYSIFSDSRNHRLLYPSYANRLQPVVICNSLVNKLTYFHYQHKQSQLVVPILYQFAIQALNLVYRTRASILGRFRVLFRIPTSAPTARN
jgi:hypothetical protein